MNDFWSKMPLDAPLLIQNKNRLFILGLIYFRIGSKDSWQGRINHIVELANANTPLNMPRWTYAKVDYALRWLRKEGWIQASRPARNKALVYTRSRPGDVLPFKEVSEPKVQIIKVEPKEEITHSVSFDDWMKEFETNERT
ncbi:MULTISPECIES: hypothetical protein [Leptospira]|uniref:Helix-turn-helix domain-containing protein n=1 Tax=Leptospira perdikensis TaxID=2484948 RepID=A0A4V3JNN1_9LEPT|nr:MULTISPECIES: hypothetical protein [Leptospira]TGL35579.1 hypothetical protein EHQ49_17540 [Leptospira perdikensis]TGM88264.1 hypothetical protein EHQ99_00165 [Leptospira bouyouniensis]